MSVGLKTVEISDKSIKGDLEKLVAKTKIFDCTDKIHIYSLFDTYMVETETGLGIYDIDGNTKKFIDEANMTNVLIREDTMGSVLNSCYIVNFNEKEIYKYNLTFGLIENTLSTDLIHLFTTSKFDNSVSNRISFEEPDLSDLKMIDETMYNFENSFEDTKEFSESKNPGIEKLSTNTKHKDLKQLIEYINKVNQENVKVPFNNDLNGLNSYILQIGDESLKLSEAYIKYKDYSTGKEESHIKYYIKACGDSVQIMNGKYSLSRLTNKQALGFTQTHLALYNRICNELYLITNLHWSNELIPGDNFNITYNASNYSIIVETRLIDKINNEAFTSRINIGDGFMYLIGKKEYSIPNVDLKPEKINEFINGKDIGLEYRLSNQSIIKVSHGKWQF